MEKELELQPEELETKFYVLVNYSDSGKPWVMTVNTMEHVVSEYDECFTFTLPWKKKP